ncbi:MULTISPECIES: hypothetical protein [unclassified Halomonas]|uniref:hypothetical protein n=1 Tax=unclassified Halomonas TaxID=2609666 RepID=UPI00207691A9|nr:MULTISPECIES: hypothetical protein [unclassified Halomonas]
MQSIIQGLLLLLIAWAGRELVQIGQQSAVLEERLSTQGAALEGLRLDLRTWNDTYYRTSDARRELDQIETRIENLNSRVSSLEARP